MNGRMGTALGALVSAAIIVAASSPAAAATSGAQGFDGVIVTSGVSGERVVVNSVIRAHGVFRGTGEVVEVPNLPGDPDSVSRDDLVFDEGSMHLVTTTLDFSVSLNPHSCVGRATLQQTSQIEGGTGQFAAASGSFTATVGGPAVLARNPDGSCSFDQAALHEVDHFTATGIMSF
jgi:hypothetical protein